MNPTPLSSSKKLQTTNHANCDIRGGSCDAVSFGLGVRFFLGDVVVVMKKFSRGRKKNKNKNSQN
jgi:hypothetical protein